MTKRHLGLVLTALIVAGGVASSAAAARKTPTYSLGATQHCLVAHGAVVGRIRRSDARRAAIADLAQRTSFEARWHGASVLFAFSKNPPNAGFLAELLRVPHDPYRVRVRSNVVLMYRPAAGRAADVLQTCLRA
jgi:hypothetical protein